MYQDKGKEKTEWLEYFIDFLNIRDNKKDKLSWLGRVEVRREQRREVNDISQEEVLKYKNNEKWEIC